MGIWESLTKNQNLLPIADALNQLADRRKKEKQFNQFVQAMDKAMNEAKNVNGPVVTEQKNNLNASMDFVPNSSVNQPLQINKLSDLTKQPEKGTTLGTLGERGYVPKTTFDKEITTKTETPPDDQTRNKRTADVYGNFYKGIAGLDTVDPNEVSRTNQLLGMITQANKPIPPEYFNLPEGGETYERKDGKITKVAENVKDKTGADKYLWHKIGEGNKDGKKVVTEENIITGEKREVPVGEKEQSDNSLGWAKFEYDREQDKKEKEKKEFDAQAKYNAIMGSPWMKKEDLIKQGFKPETFEGYDGAYLIRNEKGEPDLIFTDQDLENYAKNKVSATPNKWQREKKKDNDPLGIR